MTSGRVLKKEVYSEADKKYLVKEFTGTDGVKSLGTFIGVREDLGKLWKKRGWSAKGVEADGANDWAGSIEFKKAKSSEHRRASQTTQVSTFSATQASISNHTGEYILSHTGEHLKPHR